MTRADRPRDPDPRRACCPPKNYTLRVKMAGEKPREGRARRKGRPPPPGRREVQGAAPRPDGGLDNDAPPPVRSAAGRTGSFSKSYGLPWETIVDGSQWVLIHDFPTHEGYNHARVTAAIRMETGYPQHRAQHGVFLSGARAEGRQGRSAQREAMQALDGKTFQRWSRHRTPQNPWKTGRDNLGTHVILIEDWLEREFEK